jgi:hypothetical protein
MGGFLVAFVGFLFCIFINGFAVTLWISRPKRDSFLHLFFMGNGQGGLALEGLRV